MIVFIVAVTFYVLSHSFGVRLPDVITPHSLLSTIQPALAVILIYELILLTIAASGPFIDFIHKEFEIISLVILRDLFKLLDHISDNSDHLDTHVLTEIGVAAVGCLVLYFFIEILERIKKNGIKGALLEEVPGGNRKLVAVRDGLEIVLLLYVTGLIIFEVATWLLGSSSGQVFGNTFLQAAFSGLIVFNVLLLFITLLATPEYETLFEFSALILASIVVLVALPQGLLVGVPMIVASLLFVIMTLGLHGFARGQKLFSAIRGK